MTWATTDAYKILLARAMMGENVDLAPATVHVGDGTTFTSGQPNPPTDSDTTLADEITFSPVQPPLRAAYTVTVIGIIPGGGAPVTINEVAFKTAGGTMIARATFEPVTFQSPFGYEVTLKVQPEL